MLYNPNPNHNPNPSELLLRSIAVFSSTADAFHTWNWERRKTEITNVERRTVVQTGALYSHDITIIEIFMCY